MLMVRITGGDVAMSGVELEAARSAAVRSLEIDGIRTVERMAEARNAYIANQAWAKSQPENASSPGPWERALAAAAQALGLPTPGGIDLVPGA